MLTALQGAQDTIESLQSQLLDLQIELNQAKASLADSKRVNNQDTARLQEQLWQAELKAASKSESDSGLKALSLEVHQLRGELQSQVSGAAAAAAASQEASLIAKVQDLQEKLQQAEVKANTNAAPNSKVAEMTQELSRLQTDRLQSQNRSRQHESSAAEAEEEHRAALQVTLHVCILTFQVHTLDAALQAQDSRLISHYQLLSSLYCLSSRPSPSHTQLWHNR